MIRRAIALIVSLALMSASGWPLTCAINCAHVSSAEHVITDSADASAHRHSHNAHTSMAGSACCPAGVQVVKSGCAHNTQATPAVEGSSRISFDTAATVLTPSFSVLATNSKTAFLSSSPPASFPKTVAPNLRI